MKVTTLLAVTCLSFLALGAPCRVHAQTWEFLFEDLSWPEASNPLNGELGGSIDSFAETGMDLDTSADGFWSFLFTDLSWPEDTLSMEGVPSLGISAGE